MFDKNYLKRVAIYIVATVAALAVAFLIGYHLWMNVTSEIETIPAVPEVFSVTAEYDSWIFRDESAVTAPAGGTVVPYVTDGEKVGKNDLIASVYTSVSDEKLTELASIRSQIRLLEGKRSTVISGDLGIGDVMVSLSSSIKNGDLSYANEISSRLTALVSARANGGGDTDAVIAALEEKEAALIASFGTPIGSVYAPSAGWYYSDADGFEAAFNTDAVSDISPEALDSVLASSPDNSSSYAGRIVQTYRWYLATTMTTSDSLSFTEGGITDIRIPGISSPLEFRVESVVNGADDRTTVVFSCGTIPDSVSPDRHLVPEFTLREIEGFGIPKDAVRIQDDQTGVFTYNGVMAKFKKINILEEIDDMYIAEIYKAPEETTAVSSADGTAEVTEVTTVDPVGDGTGRKDYLWLEVNEFIIVKGKALRSGKVIG